MVLLTLTLAMEILKVLIEVFSSLRKAMGCGTKKVKGVKIETLDLQQGTVENDSFLENRRKIERLRGKRPTKRLF